MLVVDFAVETLLTTGVIAGVGGTAAAGTAAGVGTAACITRGAVVGETRVAGIAKLVVGEGTLTESGAVGRGGVGTTLFLKSSFALCNTYGIQRITISLLFMDTLSSWSLSPGSVSWSSSESWLGSCSCEACSSSIAWRYISASPSL